MPQSLGDGLKSRLAMEALEQKLLEDKNADKRVKRWGLPLELKTKTVRAPIWAGSSWPPTNLTLS